MTTSLAILLFVCGFIGGAIARSPAAHRHCWRYAVRDYSALRRYSELLGTDTPYRRCETCGHVEFKGAVDSPWQEAPMHHAAAAWTVAQLFPSHQAD